MSRALALEPWPLLAPVPARAQRVRLSQLAPLAPPSTTDYFSAASAAAAGAARLTTGETRTALVAAGAAAEVGKTAYLVQAGTGGYYSIAGAGVTAATLIAGAAGAPVPVATGAAGEAQKAVGYVGTAASAAGAATFIAAQAGLITVAAASAVVPVVGWVVAAAALAAAAIGYFAGGGPSKDWLSFSSRLAAGVRQQITDIQTLAQRVIDATTLAQLRYAVDVFNAPLLAILARGGRLPYAPTSHWDPATPPGASGTAHEGGIRIDFGEPMGKIRQAIQLKVKALVQRDNARAAAEWTVGVYRALLGRDPTPAEAQPIVKDLVDGKRTGEQVLAALRASREYQLRTAPAPMGPTPTAAASATGATYYGVPQPGAPGAARVGPITLARPSVLPSGTSWVALGAGALALWLVWELVGT